MGPHQCLKSSRISLAVRSLLCAGQQGFVPTMSCRIAWSFLLVVGVLFDARVALPPSRTGRLQMVWRPSTSNQTQLCLLTATAAAPAGAGRWSSPSSTWTPHSSTGGANAGRLGSQSASSLSCTLLHTLELSYPPIQSLLLRSLLPAPSLSFRSLSLSMPLDASRCLSTLSHLVVRCTCREVEAQSRADWLWHDSEGNRDATKTKIATRYKFTVSLENTLSEDYFSEKRYQVRAQETERQKRSATKRDRDIGTISLKR